MSTWQGPRWEYKAVNLDEFSLSDVNVQILFGDYGAQGWELVSVTSAERHTTAFFKRSMPVQPIPAFKNDKA